MEMDVRETVGDLEDGWIDRGVDGCPHQILGNQRPT